MSRALSALTDPTAAFTANAEATGSATRRRASVRVLLGTLGRTARRLVQQELTEIPASSPAIVTEDSVRSRLENASVRLERKESSAIRSADHQSSETSVKNPVHLVNLESVIR